MSAPSDRRSARRRAVGLTYANALLWAIGNGLVSTTLVIWLARELGAEGIVISWVIASPRLAGVLRLGAPQVIGAAESLARRLAGPAGGGWGRKTVCLTGYALSGAMLTVVPIAALAAQRLSSATGAIDFWPGGPLGVLVAAWCVYHLLEYTATVALWSWIGDLYPRRARSRLLGRRERWLTIGRIVGTVVSIALASLWEVVMEGAERWAPLAASASIGAALVIVAIVPLAWLPAMATAPSAWPKNPLRTAAEAFRRTPFRRLLAYSCWLGVANGVTQSAFSLYAGNVLGLYYSKIRPLEAGMRIGQAAIAPRCGDLLARYGARRVMLPAQLIVALGPLCYLLASPATPTQSYLLIGLAYALWIAWAPINIGLDSLKLGLADQENNAPYVAVYHALSDLVNAVMVIAGGTIYDVLTAGDERSLEVFAGLFLAGWVLRSLGAVLIWRLVEPRRSPSDG